MKRPQGSNGCFGLPDSHLPDTRRIGAMRGVESLAGESSRDWALKGRKGSDAGSHDSRSKRKLATDSARKDADSARKGVPRKYHVFFCEILSYYYCLRLRCRDAISGALGTTIANAALAHIATAMMTQLRKHFN